MQSLRHLMTEFLEDWRDDVSSDWRSVLDGIEPDFAGVDGSLMAEDDEVVFPGRRGEEPDGSPDGSHIFRALDGITPSDVRVVVIGQDPYPDISKATGRAFDQGDLDDWTSTAPRVAKSLRRIVQHVAAYRMQDASFQALPTGWPLTKQAILDGDLTLEDSKTLFDHWQGQGVIFLNTGLTLTRYQSGGHPHQLKGHIPLWAPVVGAICNSLARQDDIPIAFLTWGAKARQFLYRAGITKSTSRPPVVVDDLQKVIVLDRSHPVTNGFMSGENLFQETNEGLTDIGGTEISW